MSTKPFFSASQGAIAGIVSAVAATAIGAVSSFIAYQKKKLCFKQSGKNSKLLCFHLLWSCFFVFYMADRIFTLGIR